MASAKRTRQRKRAVLHEDATTIAAEVSTDLIDLGEAAVREDGTALIKLIDPGWGSSGYYSADVLETAGKDRIFPRGTQMYIDHPGLTERQDRPERSVRDLAAVLEGDGTWQPHGPDGPGLYAPAKVFESFRPLIKDLAPYIGVSIRAAAEIGSGVAEGRKGRIVERLVEAVSVDFVTKAGRGGAVISILESAGHPALVEEDANVGNWLESRIHLDFTTRADDMYGQGYITKDERIALSTGIGAALDAFSKTVEDLAPQLLDRDLWTEPDPTATEPTTESQEDTMTPEEIREAVAEAVKAEVTPIQTELAETKAKLEATETELAEAKTVGTEAAAKALATEATAHVAANEKVKALPAPAAAKVTAALAESAPATTDGKLDTAKLDEAIATAVDAEVKYLAEATGSPVTGAGDGHDNGGKATEALDAELEAVFGRLGLSESAAKIAVGGRS